MSKGPFIDFSKPVPNTKDHHITDHTPSGPIIYRPILKSTMQGTYTSAGVICNHCNHKF